MFWPSSETETSGDSARCSLTHSRPNEIANNPPLNSQQFWWLCQESHYVIPTEWGVWVSDELNCRQTSFPEIIGTKGFLFQESFGTTRTGENKPSNYRLICTKFSVENVARRRIWLSSWKVYCWIVQVCFPKLQVFSLQYSVAAFKHCVLCFLAMYL